MKLKFIIIDRLTRARDNGEYFYRYLKEKHSDIDILFGLHKESADWDRLVADGFNLVDISDPEAIKKAAINCTHFLFSEANLGYDAVAKFLDRQTTVFVYLNHGCYFQKGLVVYPRNKFDYMICGNKREYDSVIYNAKQNNWPTTPYLLTGFPRMDEQTKRYNTTQNKNIILIQPWWRENLTTWRAVESINKLDKATIDRLSKSDFITGFNSLLNSSEFKAICEQNNLQVVFKRHPVMEHIPGVFKVPSWIIDEPNELFIDLFARTKLYITDYSSNAWEVANLGVPCIYFEPDYKNLTENCHRPESIWNIKQDGIGPVTFNTKEFLSTFKALINNNFVLDQKYLIRRKEQITYLNSTTNCERCFNVLSRIVKTQKLVVTMTSWTARINNVVSVLKTVLNQTIVPDEIYLNLSETEFKDKKLPQDLLNLISSNSKIKLNWVPGLNTKPFKKIFPILKYLKDDDIIINIDDDMLLPKTFIESHLTDFRKYKTCISGLKNGPIKGYAGGLLPEVRHWFGAGSVYQKKMFNNWDKLLNEDIIKTNHDDAFYCFMSWLNGWVPESCSEFDAFTIDALAEHDTSIHGNLGCAGPIEATKTNIRRFKEVFKAEPHFNFFKTNPNAKYIPAKKEQQVQKADGQTNAYLYF